MKSQLGMTLEELKSGEKAVIAKVKGRGAFRKRIIEMGFVVGKQVIVVKNAPLKDPIQYNILGYEVSLRRSEARLIEISEKPNHQNLDDNYNGVLQIEQSLKIAPVFKNKIINVALVGNPNSGKTTIFNFASHSKERVGNYAGVTVDAKQAIFKQGGYIFNLVDLPGTYSITSYTPEEIYVKNHLINELPDVVLNVVDAANLERNLYLTTQLIDMDLKVVMALNMWDEFTEKGDRFDYKYLGQMTGIPMIPTHGTKGKGITELFEKIIDVHEGRDNTIRHIHINYGKQIEQSIKNLQNKINTAGNEVITSKVAPRYLAIKLLEQDEEELKRVELCSNKNEIIATAKQETARLEKELKDSIETFITDAKYGFIEGALKETLKPAPFLDKLTRSRLIDNIVTSKFLSYPIFLLAIWLTFQATFFIGDYPMQWIELLVSWAGNQLSGIFPDGILKDMLVDGVIGGVGGVIIFLPNILILFFFITLMETTGYMARVAFIVDKLMHKIGLHGKSFIPMLMGFGCNVPAIMATRTIENKNDRMVTMLILPFMSCSARYPVYVLIISAFFTAYKGTILFGIYLIGILLAGIVAWVMKKTIFKVETVPFVMELPPYRIPTIRSLLKQTWFKGEQYLRKMGTIILVASIIIWALGYFPTGEKIDREINQKIATYQVSVTKTNSSISQKSVSENDLEGDAIIADFELERQRLKQENSFIGRLGKFIEPIIKPLGFDWKMGVSLIAGSAAKEIVISTMGVIYQTDPNLIENQTLITRIREEKYEDGPQKGEAVFTPLVAISFMLFILIYFPCIAVIAAIKNESGQWKWSAFLAIYTTVLAWIVSFTTFQLGSLFGL